MKKEDLIKLGLDEATAQKVAEASELELKGYVPKSNYDMAIGEKNNLEASLADRDKQLEAIKKSDGNLDDFKKQIEDLQSANKSEKEKFEADMKDLRLNTAIKLSIAGKVHDEDLAAGLFDKSKLVLNEDGKVIGLDEQLKAIETNKAFLFKQTNHTQDQPGNGVRQPYTPHQGENPDTDPSVAMAKLAAQSVTAKETADASDYYFKK